MNIDRREFLQGLFLLGTLPVFMNLDLDLSEDIDEVWDALNETPFYFQVDSDGFLTDDYYDVPKLRRDAYDINTKINSLNDLLYCMDWQPFAWEINSKYYEYVESLPKNEQVNWLKEIDGCESSEDQEAIEKWSNVVGKKEFIVQMNNILEKWLDEKIDVSNEEVYADVPLSGESYVFDFFNSEPELVDQLEIGLIEGFHPGDDSEHVMLGISMESANKICVENNLPIRFELG